MPRRTHVLVAAVIATTCVHCSLLLYNEDELSEGPTAIPANDASSDTTAVDVAAGDSMTVSEAGDAGDAGVRTIPDSAVVWPTNGHAYEVVVADVDWHGAKEAAEKRGGHLATITSAAENSFVFAIAEPVEKAWQFLPADDLHLGPWIGCIQAAGSLEPDGGFGWVTGEPFTYANFGDGQPDNSAGENACHYFAYGDLAPIWNDNFSTKPLAGYVVEYE